MPTARGAARADPGRQLGVGRHTRPLVCRLAGVSIAPHQHGRDAVRQLAAQQALEPIHDARQGESLRAVEPALPGAQRREAGQPWVCPVEGPCRHKAARDARRNCRFA